MATVKVKFRASTVNNRAGSVYYQVCHGQKNRQISTRIHLFPEQWDAGNGRVITSAGNEKILKEHVQSIENDLLRLHQVIRELETRREEYTLADVVAAFRAPGARATVLEYMNEQIEALDARGKLGTARNYQRVASSFAAFLEGRDLPFSRLDDRVAWEYSHWLARRGVVRNTISFYMRVLRSVYNKAVKQRLVEQAFPFRDVYTGVDRTRKRAVDEGIVIRLLGLDLDASPSLAISRDLFIFSYCTRGMAFVDIAFLRKQNVAGGVISYCRHKTGQRLTIRVEPCIEHIVKRYETATRDSPFVFPIVCSEEPREAFRQYQTALGYHNRKLKELAKRAGIECPLSSYTPRHSWATTARNRNVPLSIISAGMGHSSEKTTLIYLAALEDSVIDQANQDILSSLNRGVSL
jgi:integrase